MTYITDLEDAIKNHLLRGKGVLTTTITPSTSSDYNIPSEKAIVDYLIGE